MIDNSESTSYSVPSTAADFKYNIQPPIEVYRHNCVTTLDVTGTLLSLIGSTFLAGLTQTVASNGSNITFACKSIPFARGIYKLMHGQYFSANVGITEVGIKHSGAGAFTTVRTLDGYRTLGTGLITFEEYFVTTSVGTITVRFLNNGKNALATSYAQIVSFVSLHLINTY